MLAKAVGRDDAVQPQPPASSFSRAPLVLVLEPSSSFVVSTSSAEDAAVSSPALAEPSLVSAAITPLEVPPVVSPPVLDPSPLSDSPPVSSPVTGSQISSPPAAAPPTHATSQVPNATFGSVGKSPHSGPPVNSPSV